MPSRVNLVWNGLEEIVGAGKKRMGRLYETWCFIEFLDLLRAGLDCTWESADLLERRPDGYGLRLRAGQSNSILGELHGSPPMMIRLDYNRLYSPRPYPDAGGSW